MKKVFCIDGGAGRVIAAIPALLKFNKLNPTINFNVVVYGLDFLYWGIPELQTKTYGSEFKDLFKHVFLDADEVNFPEPYLLPDYYKQKTSLTKAFDKLINNTNDHSDLVYTTLKTTRIEKEWVKKEYQRVKEFLKKEKTIIIQPFGSEAKPNILGTMDGKQISKEVSDNDSRSMSTDMYLKLVKKLSTDFNLIFFGPLSLKLVDDNYAVFYDVDLRHWSALIEQCDYFVGIDSVGQHMARAHNKPGTVIFGSTYPVNTSYPDYFQIIENKNIKQYSPIRLSRFDTQMANIYNDKAIDFTDEEIEEIYQKIIREIK